MFQRSAARPLALTAALLLFPACDSGDSDGGETDVSTSGTTDQGTTTANPAGSTSAQGSSSEGGESSSGGGESSSSGGTGSSSGDEGSSSEGGESSSGGEAVSYADLHGDYVDNFDGSHTLSAEAWTQAYMGMNPFALVIEQVDDDLQWVAGEEGDGGTYGRHDWAVDGDGQLRLCTGAFGEATLQDAIDAPASDTSDFDGVGCGGAFSWSILTPAE